MSGKQHHKQNPHLHRPVGATRTIPLAPPAKEKSSSSSKSKLLQSLAISWLSPRVNPTRPNRKQRSHYDGSEGNDDYTVEDDSDDNGRGVHLRQRRSSFDETQADARDGGGKPSSNLPSTATTTSNATNKLSAGDLFRQHIRQHQHQQQQQQHRRQQSGSLLTTFLLYFDALLPEYFIHFVNASDIENNGASNAVSVLERGARTVQLHAIMSQSQQSSSTQQYKRANTTAASSMTTSSFPSSAPTSPSPFPETSPSLGGNNEQQQEQHHHWLTMSPRTREKLQRVAGAVSPRHINSMKFNATLQAEWERFTSPFHLLAGAEVLYGEMLHVLDPEIERRFVNGESILSSDDYYQLFVGKSKDDRKSSSSSFIVKFDNINQKDQKDDEEVPNQYSSEPSPPTEQPSSHKRGSRRLIAMFRQVRDDLIIVGEYLCDPVLGSSHANIGSAPSIISNNISNVTSSEFTPQSTFEFTPQSSPQKKYREYGRSQSQPSTPEKNNDAVQFNTNSSPSRRNTALNHDDETEIGRQIAAKSLRNTLDALIAYVDARCVLVKIHADLCCWYAVAAPSPDGASGNKWATLAEQCRLMMAKLSFWTAGRGTMVQAALLKLEIELKALQLALLSVYHLMECDFFNCVLNVRKLHVLLGQQSTPHTSLQVKWIKASLRRTLSMMKIIFDNNSNESPLLSRSPSLHKNKPLKSLEESGQVDLLLSEFIGANDNGGSLAIIVVHRAAQNDHDEKEESSIGATKTAKSVSVSWTPLYMKSTLDRSRVDASAQTRNNPLVQMIIGISGSSEGKVNSTAGLQQVDNEKERSWPFDDWPRIEKNLTTHSEMNSRTYSVTSSPTRSNPSTKLSNDPSNATSQYHIIRITSTISILAVAQGAHHTLEESLIKLGLHLMPENIFNVSSILQTKASIAASKKNANERGGDKSKKQQVLENSALWSETGWSDVQRKKVLHSLGLRSKHSPVVSAPLKSPYVRRQISRMRQRKKKARNPLNSGHLAMFLGPELSHLI